MIKLFFRFASLIVFSAVALTAKADFTTQVQLGMTGSYYNPSTSGQGFNFEMVNTAPNQFVMIAYWYTFHPNPNYNTGGQLKKLWLVAQGNIDILRTTHTLPLYVVENGIFNTPRSTRLIRVGDLFVDIRSCEQINVAWNLYYPGQTFHDSIYENGSVGNLRLTPVQSIQTSSGVQKLCVNECITNSNGTPVPGSPARCYLPREQNLVQNKRLTADYNTAQPYAEVAAVIDVARPKSKVDGLITMSAEMENFLNDKSFAANKSAIEAEQKLVRSLNDAEYVVYKNTEAAKTTVLKSEKAGWEFVTTSK